MRVGTEHYRTIAADRSKACVRLIDQSKLPFSFEWITATRWQQVAAAIETMQVRGAPLIGATAAFGVALAMHHEADERTLLQVLEALEATRPTAVNLRWALRRMREALLPLPAAGRGDAAWELAQAIAEEDVAQNRAIGQHGKTLLADIHTRTGRAVHILTHCNAGWLATVDHGTALAPVWAAVEDGVPVHVWVGETRPRNQGLLTAWELRSHGVPHTVIADNAGGHLMQQGRVDLVLVGADRVTPCLDVANKIGTYLKALAARDNQLPFYAAVPGPTIDWALDCGEDIPIEERSGDELRLLNGINADGRAGTLRLLPASSAVANPGFDVTPARLVTGIITERGIARSEAELRRLYALETPT